MKTLSKIWESFYLNTSLRILGEFFTPTKIISDEALEMLQTKVGREELRKMVEEKKNQLL